MLKMWPEDVAEIAYQLREEVAKEFPGLSIDVTASMQSRLIEIARQRNAERLRLRFYVEFVGVPIEVATTRLKSIARDFAHASFVELCENCPAPNELIDDPWRT